MYILFTIIYLLQKHELNHRNYSKQELNVSNFSWANEYDISMHAKIQFMNKHGFVQLNTSSFDFLEFSTRQ
jgi:hypothetical protein